MTPKQSRRPSASRSIRVLMGNSGFRLNGPIGSAVRLGIAVIGRRKNKNRAVISPMRKPAVANSRYVGVAAVRGSDSTFVFVDFDRRALVIVGGIREADK